MGDQINPVYNCPDPIAPIISPSPGDGPCPGTCQAIADAMAPYTKSCLVGSGICTYKVKIGWCDPDLPTWAHCWMFYAVDSDTCVVDDPNETHHENDLARTVLFDYNLTSGKRCFVEYMGQSGKDYVIRFAQKSTGTRIYVKLDSDHFLP